MSTASALMSTAALYVVFKIIQRLFFHPLSTVPGPWYAAFSTAYEFYWDCIKDGKYIFKISDLHEKYGPIVRINPWEVHINDPTFVDTLYANPRMDKDPFYYGGFGTPNASVTTLSASLHRTRRAAVAQFFSKANVSKLEPQVLARVAQLCDRIEEHREEDKVIDISNAYRCLATDIVSEYAVPRTRNYLAQDDFAAVYNRVLRDTSGIINWNRHIRIIWPIIIAVPRWVVALFDKDGASVAVIDNQADLLSQAKAVVEDKCAKPTPTVLSAIIQHPTLPASEKTLQRIFDETVVVIGAGTETTGNTLAVLTYHVLANLNVHQTLRSELCAAAARYGIPKSEMLSIKAVETLPYLQATIKEALRMATAVSGRLPRCHPTEILTYTDPKTKKTYTFPPGTAMSMSLREIHFNASIFASPDTFDPSRWLEGTQESIAKAEKHLVAFGKGVRQCLGLELAKQEILLVVANLFWKFEFELYETGLRDVSVEHDYFAPFGPTDSKGVRVKVKGKN